MNTNRLAFLTFGFSASGFLLLLEYTSLRMTSSLEGFIQHTAQNPGYFWLNTSLTFASTILFGVTSAWSLKRWYQYGLTFKSLFAGGLGSFLSVVTTSCPVCGSTVLSSIGIFGSLSSLPFQGIELKVLSLLLLLVSLYFLVTKRTFIISHARSCPARKPIQPQLKLFYLSLGSLVLFLITGVALVKTDPLFSNVLAAQASCNAH